MSKASVNTKGSSPISKFDEEALGLVLFALGIFLAVTLIIPQQGKSSGTAGFMLQARSFFVAQLSWGAYLLPLIPLSYGALIFMNKNLNNLTRRVGGGFVVVSSLLLLQAIFKISYAGTWATQTALMLQKTLSYGAFILPTISLTLGLEVMLSLDPLSLLKQFFRQVSKTLNDSFLQVQKFIETKQDGQESAKLRGSVRKGLTTYGSTLDTLQKIYPKEKELRSKADAAKQDLQNLKKLDDNGLKEKKHKLSELVDEQNKIINRKTEDLMAMVKVERPENVIPIDRFQQDVKDGQHELSITLPSTTASAALDLLRSSMTGDINRLSQRATKLERERKSAEQSLLKPDVMVLSREMLAYQERAKAWQEVSEEFAAWRAKAQAYVGWPELAAAFDSGPAHIAETLANGIKQRPDDTLSQPNEWRTRLAAVKEEALRRAEVIHFAPADDILGNLPTLDFDFLSPDLKIPSLVGLNRNNPDRNNPDRNNPDRRSVGLLALDTAPLDADSLNTAPPSKKAVKSSKKEGEQATNLAYSDLALANSALNPAELSAPSISNQQAADSNAIDPFLGWQDDDLPFGPSPTTAKVNTAKVNTPPTNTPTANTPTAAQAANPLPQLDFSLAAVPARSAQPVLGSPLLGSGEVQTAPPKAKGLAKKGAITVELAPWEASESQLALQAPITQGLLELELPSYQLLDELPATEANSTQLKMAAEQRANLIDQTLRSFNLQARVVDFARGPSVTRYEVEPAPGEKISRISSLSNDLARALAVGSVRVEAPVPGKSVIGLEVPNADRETVTFHQAAENQSFRNTRAKLPIILGKSIDGELMVGDLAKMPHLLVAGSTGSGKSVCVNTLITSLLYKYLPTELRFLMIDPKMVELTPYDGIPHLIRSVVTNPVDAAGVLLGAVAHMERRYKMMSQVGAKNLEQFNAKMRQAGGVELPHMVIIIDELADLMITSPKEVESAIMRLAQMARATGMHLILATQRPSVDILTSLIKVNIPARIAFAVSSSHDSRTILDAMGAERLTGMGDMLFYQPGLVKPIRLQGPYISEAESARITNNLRHQIFTDTFVEAYGADFEGGIEASGPNKSEDSDFSDPLLRAAAQVCIEEGQGSVSRLQRRLSVGHSRAGRLIDSLEAMGIVGKHQGSKPRDVLITEADLPEYFGH